MKKKVFALSGVFMIVLVITGLWAAKAINLMGVEQTIDPAATSLATAPSMREMAEGASLIVIGKCLETRSQWVERRLVTLATVSVTERIKDDVGAADPLTVVLPGGIDSMRKFPVAMTYAGAPQISPDEEVFLFLTGPDEIANGYSVMGFAQGKFSIAEDIAGEKVVTRGMTRARIEKGVGVTRGNLQVVPLSKFKEQVKSYLR